MEWRGDAAIISEVVTGVVAVGMLRLRGESLRAFTASLSMTRWFVLADSMMRA
jgi:hypothetical protein